MREQRSHPLTRIREQQNLTQDRLAEVARISARTIMRAENNRPIGAESRRRLCEYFGRTAEELGLQLPGSLATPEMATEEESLNKLPLTSQHILSVEEPLSASRKSLESPFLEFQQELSQVTVLASHNEAFHPDITARLTQALTKPSNLDEKTLLYLERRIENYWQDRNDVALPAWDLLPYVLEDLQKATTLLEGSLSPTIRTHLCSIAGAAAMLIGELHYDQSNYAHARSFQELAITAAHEANNGALEAVAWARNSFAWTYDGNSSKAYNSIQQARHLKWSVNSTVRTWLAAVEAEVQAHLGNRAACLKALNEAALVEDKQHQKEECYWIHFDRSLFAGYQGVSFLRLSSRGHKDLVQNAQTTLHDALDLLDPSMKRRQPTLFVDLAGTYVQQQNIEEACGCALKAMNIATQINSNVSVQRLLLLRGSLERWKETCYVQDLDEALGPLFALRRQ